MLLQATQRFAEQVWVWPALLISSMISVIALLRAGTFFFWQTGPYTAPEGRRVRAPQFVAISVLLVTIGLLTVFAEATVSYSQDAARDIQDHLNANHHQQESTS
jgi:multicomponent K+:H+ antiporter subunit D